MEFKRPDWDEFFMLQAELVKLRANCITKKVGAIITNNNIQISAGYNGTPSGLTNCYEGGCERCAMRMRDEIKSGELLDRCLCNHAESNAILHCSMLGIPMGNDSVMYTTYVPCIDCSKMIITTGIKRVVCLETYPEDNQILLESAGIKCKMMDTKKFFRWLDDIKRENL